MFHSSPGRGEMSCLGARAGWPACSAARRVRRSRAATVAAPVQRPWPRHLSCGVYLGVGCRSFSGGVRGPGGSGAAVPPCASETTMEGTGGGQERRGQETEIRSPAARSLRKQFVRPWPRVISAAISLMAGDLFGV